MTYFQHLNEIKKAYQYWQPKSDPYSFYDWDLVFTRIEWNVWSDIRYLGLPFYPQFPVGKYFIDFADPENKIAIEADGKDWHNTERDRIRDQELNKLNWKVIRLPGKITFKEYEDYFDDHTEEWLRDLEPEQEEEERQNLWSEYITNSSEGILRELKEEYYK